METKLRPVLLLSSTDPCRAVTIGSSLGLFVDYGVSTPRLLSPRHSPDHLVTRTAHHKQSSPNLRLSQDPVAVADLLHLRLHLALHRIPHAIARPLPRTRASVTATGSLD